MNFRFGLDRVLWLRAQAESERARALADARSEQDLRREEAERSEARGRDAADQARAPRADATPAGVLRALEMAKDVAAAGAVRAREVSDQADRVAEEEHGRFDAARRDRRALERLREQRQQDWTLEQSRAEQRDIDALGRRRVPPGGEER